VIDGGITLKSRKPNKKLIPFAAKLSAFLKDNFNRTFYPHDMRYLIRGKGIQKVNKS